ncbi:hypothetical protein F4823DRAFT_568218 [Ustulina deusta]|nr:hypothetical protein F4823DRAFT_568218 [Ustulina deusta]
MADSTIDIDDGLPPYQYDKDPISLQKPVHKYIAVNLEGIPPTRRETHSTEQQGIAAEHAQDEKGNEQVENMKKGIMAKLNGVSAQSSKGDIELWLQDCESLNLKVDINRLARFAICRNAVEVVKYLVDEVDEGKADLINSWDIYGSSAIFYAMWDYPDSQMFQYLTPKIRENLESLNHEDDRKLTVWHFAIALKSLDAFEFLLELDRNTRITQNITKDWVKQLRRVGLQGRSLAEAGYLQSLVGFNDLLETMPKFPVFGMGQGGSAWGPIGPELLSHHSVLQLGARENDFRWVHLPWVNFALRQFGRDLGYPTCASDWLPSIFRQPVKVPANSNLPYTDPIYESNFGDRQTSRAFIVFPCLILRSRASQNKERTRINELRGKFTDNPAKNMLQPELTLDEAYFPSLPSDVLDERNNTQLVSRQCTETLDGQLTNEDTKPILMVPQLWLWRCGSHIITAFPENDPEALNGSLQRCHDYMRYLTTFFLQPIPSSPGIQIGLLIAYQIVEFGNPQVDGGFGNAQDDVKYPSPLDIFEASIAQVLTDIPKYMDLNASSTRLETGRGRDSLSQIADVREELAMISQVLAQQLQVLQNFIKDFERDNPDSLSFLARDKRGRLKKEVMQESEIDATGMERWEEVKRSQNTIEKYQGRVKKLLDETGRVQRRMQYQLDLKLTYASIDDAYANLKLGITVMGFTVVTIIFAPL